MGFLLNYFPTDDKTTTDEKLKSVGLFLSVGEKNKDKIQYVRTDRPIQKA